MKSFLRFLIFVLLLTLAISLLYIWQVKQPVLRTESQKVTLAQGPLLESGSVPLLERLSNEYTALAQAVVPSVVSITTTKTVVQPRFFDPFELFFRRFSHGDPNTQKVSILGSGAIVSKEGHIITNDHVVSGTDEILVQLHDGRKARARLVGSDPQIDLAVLKIDLDNLSPISLADSDDVKVGQLVFAIGSPFGLEGSVSQGIISAKGRRALSESSLEYFQTDTAINPGNSGGPLVDIHGRMVGMNTAIYSESGGNQGIGFAIPSNVVNKALISLIQHGRIVHGYLGVSVEPVTQDIANRMQLASTAGAVITKVTARSPAAKAGLQKGDVILKVDGKELRDSSALSQYLGQIEVGDNLALEINRSGTKRALVVPIEEEPAAAEEDAAAASPTAINSASFAGIQVTDLTDDLRTEASVPDSVHGVIVIRVDPSGAAGQTLRPGDIIEEINRHPIYNVQDFEKITNRLDAGRPIILALTRNGQRSFLIIQPNQ